MTCVPTVLTLVTRSVEQELVAEGTKNDLVELSLHKLVTVHLVHLVLAFAYCALATKDRRIQRPPTNVLLDYLFVEQMT